MEMIFDNSFEPKVGEKYRVPVVIMYNVNLQKRVYVPILGNLHEDPELNQFVGKHYHVDGRFATPVVKHIFSMIGGITNHVIMIKDSTTNPYKFVKTSTRLMKCVRTETGVNPPMGSIHYQNWQRKYVGKEVKNGICPHLGTVMQKQGKFLVCPLHGLVACEGKIVPRINLSMWEYEASNL